MSRPIIAITMGDPAGIGPEIILKSLARPEIYDLCRPLVIGDAGRLKKAGGLLNRAGFEVASALRLRTAADHRQALFQYGEVDVVQVGSLPASVPFGKVSKKAGEAAYRYIVRACQIAQAGDADAICTAPVSKEAIMTTVPGFTGHTELLAELTGKEVSLMLKAPISGGRALRVVHVTTHIGLLDAIELIDPPLVERTIERGHDALVKAGIKRPKIGVCAINPHAGEGEHFGRKEEANKIKPAVEASRRKGWNVEGPLPADALFYLAGQGKFDLVVAMYHDQGHCPIKVLGIDAGVNITLGLPVVRTSVDHGTAFDKAGKGIASELSLIEAIREAVELAPKGRL